MYNIVHRTRYVCAAIYTYHTKKHWTCPARRFQQKFLHDSYGCVCVCLSMCSSRVFVHKRAYRRARASTRGMAGPFVGPRSFNLDLSLTCYHIFRSPPTASRLRVEPSNGACSLLRVSDLSTGFEAPSGLGGLLHALWAK